MSFFAGAGYDLVVLARCLGIDEAPLPDGAATAATARAQHMFADCDHYYVLYSYIAGKLEYGFAFHTDYDELHRRGAKKPPKAWYDDIDEFAVEYQQRRAERHRVTDARYQRINDGRIYLGSLSRPFAGLTDIREVTPARLQKAMQAAVAELRHRMTPWPLERAALDKVAIVRFADGKLSTLPRKRPSWLDISALYHTMCAAPWSGSNPAVICDAMERLRLLEGLS